MRQAGDPAGQAALVADVYQKWVVGRHAQAAQDAAVLFQNANNPGDPQVQAILKHLPNATPVSREPAYRAIPGSCRPSRVRNEVNSCLPPEARWQQVTALVSLGAGGAITGFSFVPGTPADLTSPTSMPVRLMALEQSARPAAAGDASAALGHRERGQLLPADGREQDPGRDGSDHLAARQHRRR